MKNTAERGMTQMLYVTLRCRMRKKRGGCTGVRRRSWVNMVIGSMRYPTMRCRGMSADIIWATGIGQNTWGLGWGRRRFFITEDGILEKSRWL